VGGDELGLIAGDRVADQGDGRLEYVAGFDIPGSDERNGF